MYIYGSSFSYMHISFFPICAYTEGINAHIRKRVFVYVHLQMEEMCIYGRELSYMRILPSINAHFSFCICAFMKGRNVYIRKLSSVYVNPIVRIQLPTTRFETHRSRYTSKQQNITKTKQQPLGIIIYLHIYCKIYKTLMAIFQRKMRQGNGLMAI